MGKTKEKVIYYSDEKNDDFSGTNIKRKNLKSNYKYTSYNPLTWFMTIFLTYIIVIPIFFFVGLFKHRITYKNKKVLKQTKGKGCYLYSNHTLILDPGYDTMHINLFKRHVIIASTETFSINPIISYIVRCLDVIPVPNKNDELMSKNYIDYLSKSVTKKHRKVIMYPERHIWSYYNDIREFTSGQFRYPVNDNVPSYSITKTYVKTKFRKRPKVVCYISGPFYPDNSLPYEDRVNKLRDEIYASMKQNVKEHGSYAYIKYIKKEKDI